MFDDVTTVEQYTALLAQKFGRERLADALAQYPASSAQHVEAALGAISNDLWYFMGSWAMADLLVEPRDVSLSKGSSPPPVYFYKLNEPGFTKHGGDTPMWNAAKWPPGKKASKASEAAMTYLCQFARTGDPNPPTGGSPTASGELGGMGLPGWEAHTREAPRYMEIGPTLGMRSRTKEEHARYDLLGGWIRGQQ